ncbi:MAG: hypothetical protein KDK76_01390 [Chlamydiia bacterium]|nr:hypothetical protein [Chlamydiia bacterium]
MATLVGLGVVTAGGLNLLANYGVRAITEVSQPLQGVLVATVSNVAFGILSSMLLDDYVDGRRNGDAKRKIFSIVGTSFGTAASSILFSKMTRYKVGMITHCAYVAMGPLLPFFIRFVNGAIKLRSVTEGLGVGCGFYERVWTYLKTDDAKETFKGFLVAAAVATPLTVLANWAIRAKAKVAPPIMGALVAAISSAVFTVFGSSVVSWKVNEKEPELVVKTTIIAAIGTLVTAVLFSAANETYKTGLKTNLAYVSLSTLLVPSLQRGIVEQIDDPEYGFYENMKYGFKENWGNIRKYATEWLSPQADD